MSHAIQSSYATSALTRINDRLGIQPNDRFSIIYKAPTAMITKLANAVFATVEFMIYATAKALEFPLFCLRPKHYENLTSYCRDTLKAGIDSLKGTFSFYAKEEASPYKSDLSTEERDISTTPQSLPIEAAPAAENPPKDTTTETAPEKKPPSAESLEVAPVKQPHSTLTGRIWEGVTYKRIAIGITALAGFYFAYQYGSSLFNWINSETIQSNADQIKEVLSQAGNISLDPKAALPIPQAGNISLDPKAALPISQAGTELLNQTFLA